MSKSSTVSRSVIDRLRRWARRIREEAFVLWLAAKHPNIPIAAKLLAFFVAAYAFSPVDLIPDFIPALGLLDDFLIVPAGVWLAMYLIPASIEHELRAAARERKDRPVSRVGLALVVTSWFVAALLAWRWLA